MEIVEKLLQGRLRLSEAREISVYSASFLEDPFNGVSSSARLSYYSLQWIEVLLQSYEQHGGDQKLELAGLGAMRWAKECLFAEGNGNVWSDHATAFRTLVLCHLSERLADATNLDGDLDAQIRRALWRHGRRLRHPAFYRPEHDHGITQAYALLACGLTLGGADGQRWTACGQERLEMQMRDNVSEEGLHREQSAYYHFYAFRQFFDAWELLQSVGHPFSESYEEKLRRMLIAGANWLKPSGGLFAFGDSDRESPIVLRGDESDRLRLAASAFSFRGCCNPGTLRSVVLKDGGMAFLRKRLEVNGRSSPIIVPVRTATLDIAHSHRDLTSFELSAFGDDLVVDSGGPYAYGTRERKYFVSTAAHNTVVRRGQEQRYCSAEIRRWETNAERDLLDLEHRAYGKVAHRRTMMLDKSGFLLLVDQLSGPRRGDWAVLFHLGTDLEPRMENGKVVARNVAGRTGLRMESLSAISMKTSMGRGSGGAFESWVSSGERTREPNWVIAYEIGESCGELITLVVPETPGERLSANLECEWKGTTLDIEVRCRGARRATSVARLRPEVVA